MRFWPMIPVLSLTAVLFATGCASSRAQRPVADADTCTAVVETDVIVGDSTRPDSTLEIRRGYRSCHSLAGLRQTARRTACRDGFAFAHVYNVQPPGPFSGVCAQGDVDLYRVEPARAPSPRPVITYAALPNPGLEVYAAIAVGNAVGGTQREPGLDPRPAVSKSNVGLEADYFWNRLGVEAGADVYGKSVANKEKYRDVDLYYSTLLRLGGVATVWDRTLLTYRIKVDVSAGGNFALVRLHDEYRELIGEGAIDDLGTGFGGYGRVRLKTFLRNGLGSYVGVRYEYENATLKGASEPLDAHNLQAMIGFGYKF